MNPNVDMVPQKSCWNGLRFPLLNEIGRSRNNCMILKRRSIKTSGKDTKSLSLLQSNGMGSVAEEISKMSNSLK